MLPARSAVHDDRRRLRFEFSWDPAVHARAIVERFAGHCVHLLASGLADPGRAIGGLRLMDDEERARILSMNEPGPAADPHTSVVELIETQAVRTPDAVALSAGDTHLTYEELDLGAGVLGSRLAGAGVGCESRVAVALPRGISQIVSLYAVLKAGAAYVPIDPAQPPARIRHMLSDSGARVAIATPAIVERGGLRETGAVVIEPPAPRDRGVAPGPWPRPIPGDALAYVIYTSGSTGEPKGVCIAHGQIALLAAAQSTAFGVGAGTIVCQFASLTFDASVSEIFTALTAGARLVLLPPQHSRAGEELFDTLRSEDGRGRDAAAVRADDVGGRGPAGAALVVAGEACPAGVVSSWAAGRRMLNGYGPTETTVCATISSADRGPPSDLGRPIDHARVYAGRRGRARSVRRLGELALPVAAWRGYHGRPRSRTASCPTIRGAAGGRLYHGRPRTMDRRACAGVPRAAGSSGQDPRPPRRGPVRSRRCCSGIRPSIASRSSRGDTADGEKRLVAYVGRAAALNPHDLRAYLDETLP
jgi:non-ribosomal peptide synthetase component F